MARPFPDFVIELQPLRVLVGAFQAVGFPRRNFDAAVGAEFGWWLGCVGHLSVPPIACAFTSINSRNWKPSAIGPNLPDRFGRSPNPPAQLRQGGDSKGGG